MSDVVIAISMFELLIVIWEMEKHNQFKTKNNKKFHVLLLPSQWSI